MKAMRALLDTDAPAALILEDDAEVGASVPAIIQSVEWWPEGHGLVKLDSSYTDREKDRVVVGDRVGSTPDGRSLHPIIFQHMGAYGYLIDRATAGQVLGVAPDVPMPIDQLLFAPRGSALKDSPLARHAQPLQMTPGAVRHPPYSKRKDSEVRAAGRHAYMDAPWPLKGRRWSLLRRRPYKKNLLGRLAERRAMARLVKAGHAQRIHVPFEG